MDILANNKKALGYYTKLLPAVKDFCAPLSDYLGIKLFMWLKMYKSGKYLHISTDSRMGEFVFQQLTKTTVYFRNYLKFADKQKSYDCILWPLQPQNVGMELCIKLGYWHGISLIPMQSSSDCIEMACFLTDKDNVGMSEFYYKHLKVLERFANQFRQVFRNEIKIDEQNHSLGIFEEGIDLFIPDRNHSQANEQEIIKSFYKKIGSSTQNKINLSSKQLECLNLLGKGYYIKEIAEMLSLSSRTVETHLNRIKEKTGTRYKSDLIKLCENEIII